MTRLLRSVGHGAQGRTETNSPPRLSLATGSGTLGAKASCAPRRCRSSFFFLPSFSFLSLFALSLPNGRPSLQDVDDADEALCFISRLVFPF